MIRSGVLLLLTCLYFAQGLPFGLFSQALPVLLRQHGYSLTAISASGVLFLPWACKFLWAPAVDRTWTRKRWLLAMQLASAATALTLATIDLSGSLRPLLVGVAVLNVFSATQDIATDSLAVRMLGERDRGLGNGIQTGAYRLGMIAGGGALLWLYSWAGWRALFLSLAAAILLCTLPVLFLRTESDGAGPRAGTASPVPGEGPAPSPRGLEWWRRLRRPGVLVFIVLIGAFKFGDSMGSALVGPYLSDTGFTLGQIALLKGTFSSIGALAGSALGGWIAFRYGRRPALLFGGITQTLSLAMFAVAASGIGGYALIVGASLAEHVLGGAATVALFTLMMDASDRDFAGSDYTLLACAVVVVQGAAGVFGGILGDLAGYPAVFGTAFILSAGGCFVLVRGLDRSLGPHLGTWHLAPAGR